MTIQNQNKVVKLGFQLLSLANKVPHRDQQKRWRNQAHELVKQSKSEARPDVVEKLHDKGEILLRRLRETWFPYGDDKAQPGPLWEHIRRNYESHSSFRKKWVKLAALSPKSSTTPGPGTVVTNTPN